MSDWHNRNGHHGMGLAVLAILLLIACIAGWRISCGVEHPEYREDDYQDDEPSAAAEMRAMIREQAAEDRVAREHEIQNLVMYCLPPSGRVCQPTEITKLGGS